MSQNGQAGKAVYIAPTLAVDVCMAAKALEEAKLLGKLVTKSTVSGRFQRFLQCLPGGSYLGRRNQLPVAAPLARRVFGGDFLQCFGPILGTTRANDLSFARIDQIATQYLDSSTLAVIGREDACEASFQKAQEIQVPTLYQLPTGYYRSVRKLMEREANLYPEEIGKTFLQAEYSEERCQRKDRELNLSDVILVHSEYSRQSLLQEGIESDRIRKITFGVDVERWNGQACEKENCFLYVGNISARKGVHRLVEVWKALKAYRTHRLKLIGDMDLSPSFLRENAGIFDHIPRINRPELETHYRRASAFVFNSMADGFGNVLGEAMACGTCVLASQNSGAPELLRDGREGRLFAFGENDKLAEVLDWALTHPNELASMGRAARSRALETTWEQFGSQLCHLVRSLSFLS